ncbi:hypothetical protein METP1_03469 [Methanosarcinales archaeon]|nr:hypothetical protein METP1_03469 [Methanosarcinales archaeon]
MLETMEERVKLLKAGFDGKSIEELYLKYNNIKILGGLQHELNCCEFKRLFHNNSRISDNRREIPGCIAARTVFEQSCFCCANFL